MAEINGTISTTASSNIASSNVSALQTGDVFSARVVSSNAGSNEVVLKLSDGSQVNAKVDGQTSFNTNGPNKFVVEGYENGEIKVKLFQNSSNVTNNLDGLLKNFFGDNITAKDYSMVNSLIKYNIPLTKENLLYAKAIMDFQNNINENPSKELEFINNYSDSRNIDMNSLEQKETVSILKALCSSIKNVKTEELAILMANDIDISGENTDSFNNVFKGNGAIFKDLVSIKDEINKEIKTNSNMNEIVDAVVSGKIKGGSKLMPSISNLNGLSGLQNKTTRKLSFNVGEVFGARVVDYNEETKEATLKLADGWKFSAKLSSGLTLDENGFYRFSVLGYDGGKINLKTVKEENDEVQSDILDRLLNDNEGEGLKGEDATLLKSLIKHGLPLTKENISYAKSIIDFRENITKNPEREDEFIDTYLNSKNIDKNSDEANNIRSTIKEFFNELKNFNDEELTTFIENGIEVSEDNIKSFNNVFKNDAAINKELKGLNNAINEAAKEDTSNKTENNMSSKALKDEVNSKIQDMKNTIKDLLNLTASDKMNSSKVMDMINKNMNDFKLFNTMSKEYYYMDVPVNFRDNEYNFKMIIKDDRKSGKKIDSKNVKLAASVKTVNMGVVDAYITVNNNKLDIDIKTEKKWARLLDLAKTSLMNKVESMGYNVKISVKEKQDEFNIINCREFFNNEIVGNLDTRV